MAGSEPRLLISNSMVLGALPEAVGPEATGDVSLALVEVAGAAIADMEVRCPGCTKPHDRNQRKIMASTDYRKPSLKTSCVLNATSQLYKMRSTISMPVPSPIAALVKND